MLEKSGLKNQQHWI